MPWLGAIGGQILPEYEILPPKWLLQYERVLAIRRAVKSRWSNAEDDWQSQPWGAGMVIRRIVCTKYIEKIFVDKRFAEFGRKGDSLLSSEDVDMVLTSRELGLGFGVFPDMIVTHLIPKRRMSIDYICRITSGLVASNLLLAELRGEAVTIPMRRSLYTEIRSLYHFLKRSSINKSIESATQMGVEDFHRFYRQKIK